MVLYRAIFVRSNGDMDIRHYETLNEAYASCLPMDQSNAHIKVFIAVREELESMAALERNVSFSAVLVGYDDAPRRMEWFIQQIHQGAESPLPTHFLRPQAVPPAQT